MFRYIAKNPKTGEAAMKLFSSAKDANQHALKNINSYPVYKIIFVQDLININEVGKQIFRSSS
jgi:hypothetical protein